LDTSRWPAVSEVFHLDEFPGDDPAERCIEFDVFAAVDAGNALSFCCGGHAEPCFPLNSVSGLSTVQAWVS